MTQRKLSLSIRAHSALSTTAICRYRLSRERSSRTLRKDGHPTRFKPDDAEIHAGCGIGLLTGQGEHKVIGIDCDITDLELLQLIYDKLSEMCGGSHKFLSRVGRRPRTLFLVRTDKSFSKVSSHKFLDDRGQEQQLEILANGQQFVAFGRHKGYRPAVLMGHCRSQRRSIIRPNPSHSSQWRRHSRLLALSTTTLSSTTGS